MKTVRLTFDIPVEDLSVSNEYINVKFAYQGTLKLKNEHPARLSWDKNKKAYSLVILKDPKGVFGKKASTVEVDKAVKGLL